MPVVTAFAAGAERRRTDPQMDDLRCGVACAPPRGRPLRADLLNRSAGQHRFGCRAQNIGLRLSELIILLDEQPSRCLALCDTCERIAAMQLLAIEPESNAPCAKRGLYRHWRAVIVRHVAVRSRIPHDHAASAVFALRNDAFERGVLE